MNHNTRTFSNFYFYPKLSIIQIYLFHKQTENVKIKINNQVKKIVSITETTL